MGEWLSFSLVYGVGAAVVGHAPTPVTDFDSGLVSWIGLFVGFTALHYVRHFSYQTVAAANCFGNPAEAQFTGGAPTPSAQCGAPGANAP